MRSRSTLVFVALALALAVGLGTAASPFASSRPDGLERVADEKGFLARATTSEIQEEAPIADYAFPGIADERVATGVAGFVGTLGMFALVLGVGWVLRRGGAAGDRPTA